MRLSGGEKDKMLSAAKQDISITSKLYPDLGDEQWKPKYDNLLKKIQNGLGEPAVGLSAL